MHGRQLPSTSPVHNKYRVEHLIDHTVENTITELTVMKEDLTLITDHLVITYQLAIRDLKTKL